MKLKDIILYVFVSICVVCSLCIVCSVCDIIEAAIVKDNEIATNATYKWVSFTEYYTYESTTREWRSSDERILSQCWYESENQKIAYDDNDKYRNINITIAYHCLNGVLGIEGGFYYTNSERDMIYLDTKGYWSEDKTVFYIDYDKTAPIIYSGKGTLEVYGHYIITGEKLTLILPNE